MIEENKKNALWWSWKRLKHEPNFIGLWFMLPASAFLILFLAYPLGLGVWLGFTDSKIARPGSFIGIENFEWLFNDSVLLTTNPGNVHIFDFDSNKRI